MRQLIHGVDEKTAGQHEQDRAGKIDRNSFDLFFAFFKSFSARNAPQMPIGRLMKKIQRQPIVSIKNPPRVGPVKNPTWKAIEAKPMALPRSLDGNATERSPYRWLKSWRRRALASRGTK